MSVIGVALPESVNPLRLAERLCHDGHDAIIYLGDFCPLCAELARDKELKRIAVAIAKASIDLAGVIDDIKER